MQNETVSYVYFLSDTPLTKKSVMTQVTLDRAGTPETKMILNFDAEITILKNFGSMGETPYSSDIGFFIRIISSAALYAGLRLRSSTALARHRSAGQFRALSPAGRGQRHRGGLLARRPSVPRLRIARPSCWPSSATAGTR